MLEIASFFVIAWIHYLMVEFPLRSGDIFRIKYLKSTLAGYSVIVFLNSLFCMTIGYPRTTLTVLTAFYLIFGIVNFYIYRFHGDPFTLGELKNFKTAMAVVKGYTLTVPFGVLAGSGLLLLFVAVMIVSVHFDSFSRMTSLWIFVISGIAFFLYYLSPKPFLNKKLLLKPWNRILEECGYIPAFVLQTKCEMGSPMEKPEGYDKDSTVSFVRKLEKTENTDDRRPDIIFLVNETFYDLQEVMDLQSDKDALSGFRSIDGAIKGRTVTPRIGGGTSVSEYECLTANSMQLLPYVATPFNVLDMSRANTVLTYLKSLGYKTAATHPGESYSYRRNIAYPAMGFDNIFFGKDYEEPEFYGKRTSFMTDSSMYKNLIRWYQDLSKDEDPMFIYGLTIQNHGDYVSNTDDLSLIHTGGDFGKFNHIFDEFLSCIKLSDDAFMELISFFETVERDVIIVMTGDHAPSFVKEKDYLDLGGKDDFLSMSSTPYIIWSNRELHKPENTDAISMPYLLPTVFEAAGMRLPSYYDFLADMRTKIPVLKRSDDSGLSEEERKLLEFYYSFEYLNYSEPDATREFWV